MVKVSDSVRLAQSLEDAAVRAVTGAGLVTSGARPTGVALLALVEDLLKARVEAVLGHGYGVFLTDRSVSVTLPAVVGWMPRFEDYVVHNSRASLRDLAADGTGLALLLRDNPALEGVDWLAPSFPGITVELEDPTGNRSSSAIGVLVLAEQGAAVQSHRAGSSGPEGERRSAYETNDLMVLP